MVISKGQQAQGIQAELNFNAKKALKEQRRKKIMNKNALKKNFKVFYINFTVGHMCHEIFSPSFHFNSNF